MIRFLRGRYGDRDGGGERDARRDAGGDGRADGDRRGKGRRSGSRFVSAVEAETLGVACHVNVGEDDIAPGDILDEGDDVSLGVEDASCSLLTEEGREEVGDFGVELSTTSSLGVPSLLDGPLEGFRGVSNIRGLMRQWRDLGRELERQGRARTRGLNLTRGELVLCG